MPRVPVADRPRDWLVKVPTQSAFAQNPIPLTGNSLRQGKAVYTGVCIACHGPDGFGQATNPIFRALKPKPLHFNGRPTLPDGIVHWVIQNGIEGTPMKAQHRNISQREAWHLVNYLHTLARPWLQEVKPQVLTQKNPSPLTQRSIELGQKHYQDVCIVCHGPSGLGNSTDPFFGTLGAKPLHSLGKVILPDGVIAWIIQNGLPGTHMKKQDHRVAPEARWDLINYIHTLAGRGPKVTPNGNKSGK
jgi:mono/diheme cytochrome c family protein